MRNSIDLICRQHDWSNRIRLYGRAKDPDAFDRGKERRFGKIEITEVDLDKWSEPFLELDRDEAQKLMDELWQCGLRPSEGTGSAGSLAATERHLKDMQNIAKGALKRAGIDI